MSDENKSPQQTVTGAYIRTIMCQSHNTFGRWFQPWACSQYFKTAG